jgi:hypothetical protein
MIGGIETGISDGMENGKCVEDLINDTEVCRFCGAKMNIDGHRNFSNAIVETKYRCTNPSCANVYSDIRGG